MLPTELARFKTLYTQTAWDYVRLLEHDLLRIADDPKNADAIESLHISAHSLKSQSLVMKYEHLGLVCRDMEILFKEVKDGNRLLTEGDIQTLSEVVTGIKEALAAITANDAEHDMVEEAQKLNALLKVPGG
jgi:chemotaxis protein histidine kinase CheA